MKDLKNILTIVLSMFCLAAVAQQHEVVIIGTMHGVYGLTKKAYKPMLKKAIKYQPEAVYMEVQPSWDTVSVKNYQSHFYHLSDSLRQVRTFDLEEIERLKSKATADLTKEEAKELRLYYYVNLDLGNVWYYGRIARSGVNLKVKSRGHENHDLSLPLALAMGIKEVRSMDNQTYYREYYETWKGCDTISTMDGENKYLKKALRQTWWNDVTGVLFFGGLGRINNTPKNYELYHRINSMEYRKTNTEVCDQANYYWDFRNTQMVKNTAEQMIASGHQRSVIVVGSGHVYGMMEAFARDYPNINVIGYLDMPNNIGKVDRKK